MQIALWILFGLFFVTLFLFVFSQFTPLKILSLIGQVLMLPVAAAYFVINLSQFLPDSTHLIIIICIAFVISTAGCISFQFEENKKIRNAARLFILSAFFIWIFFYKNSFSIFRINSFIKFLFILLYSGLFIATSVITGKQKLSFYIWSPVCFTGASILNYCTLLPLIAEHNLADVLAFTGSALFYATVIYYLLDTRKYNFKYSVLVRTTGTVLSQILLALSGLLLFLLK